MKYPEYFDNPYMDELIGQLVDIIYREPDIAIEALRHYIAMDGDVNIICEGEGLLHAAAREQNFELIKLLIEAGADVNIRDTEGETPLHIAIDRDVDGAIQEGQRATLETTRLLISLGADPEIRNMSG